MTETVSRLQGALADRYRIERELGHGGMATVYLAEDLKHHRKVAVKVLRPELAATLGAERFLREIEIAARLQHPHILAVLDSGEAGGFLYYVMPFVEGEIAARPARARGRAAGARGGAPARARWRTRSRTPTATASSTATSSRTTCCCRGRHALVTDFGVAKAVTEAIGRQHR